MSRKWSRMIEKNKKQINQTRQKQGKKPIKVGDTEKFVGRNWLFPAFLFAAAAFFTFGFSGIYDSNTLYWVTIVLYVVLGLIHLLIRRPYLKIGKTSLASLRFGGEKTYEADTIERIELSKGYVVLVLRNKKVRITFSKFIHRMPTDEMAERLIEFAKSNSVEVTHSDK